MSLRRARSPSASRFSLGRLKGRREAVKWTGLSAGRGAGGAAQGVGAGRGRNSNQPRTFRDGATKLKNSYEACKRRPCSSKESGRDGQGRKKDITDLADVFSLIVILQMYLSFVYLFF